MRATFPMIVVLVGVTGCINEVSIVGVGDGGDTSSGDADPEGDLGAEDGRSPPLGEPLSALQLAPYLSFDDPTLWRSSLPGVVLNGIVDQDGNDALEVIPTDLPTLIDFAPVSVSPEGLSAVAQPSHDLLIDIGVPETDNANDWGSVELFLRCSEFGLSASTGRVEFVEHHEQLGRVETYRMKVPDVWLKGMEQRGCKDFNIAIQIRPASLSPAGRYIFDNLRLELAVSQAPIDLQASYQFPFWGDDLASGVRLSVGPRAVPGPRSLGLNIAALRYTGSTNWSPLLLETDGSRSEHFVAYGTSFYAMAPGEVVACWRRAQEAGSDLPVFDDGNHLWIRQDDGAYVLFAHLKDGSIPEELCPPRPIDVGSSIRIASSDHRQLDPITYQPLGVDPAIPTGAAAVIDGRLATVDRVRVQRGQYLGQIGSSGDIASPQLHIHAEVMGSEGIEPVELRFDRGMFIPREGLSADIDDVTSFNGDVVPNRELLIWPPHRMAQEVFRLRLRAENFSRMSAHFTNSGLKPVWFDAYSVGDELFYNFIWKPETGATMMGWDLSAEALGDRISDGVEDGYTPVFIESYLSEEELRYALIMEPDAGGDFIIDSGLSVAEHEAMLEVALSRGLSPVCVSVVSFGGELQYTVLYRNYDLGGWIVRSRVPASEYASLVEEEWTAGRRPHYVASYEHQGGPYYATIFSSRHVASSMIFGLSEEAYVSENDRQLYAGRAPRVISGRDGAAEEHEYIGVWR